jgi:hypothetical protein
MNRSEYLADMNRELIAMGLKPVRTIEEAQRPSTVKEAPQVAERTQGRGNGNGASRKPGSLATEAQIKYIIELTFRITGMRDAIEDVNVAGFTKAEASEMIGRLIPIEREAQRTRAASVAASLAAPVKSTRVTEDGMYLKDGVVFKVQIAKQGSGRLYAKRLTENGFEYAQGAINTLRSEHKMSLEQAKEYGRLYGVCCQCGTELTDENSIAAGIGPICAGKF